MGKSLFFSGIWVSVLLKHNYQIYHSRKPFLSAKRLERSLQIWMKEKGKIFGSFDIDYRPDALNNIRGEIFDCSHFYALGSRKTNLNFDNHLSICRQLEKSHNEIHVKYCNNTDILYFFMYIYTIYYLYIIKKYLNAI